jgi:hypothetical protein
MGHRNIRRVLFAAAMVLLTACSSKLKEDMDFRPYFASWVGKNCGKQKEYRCLMHEGFHEDGFDGEDYVYGIYHVGADGKKRVLYVKVQAVKPHEVTVVGDEPAPG